MSTKTKQLAAELVALASAQNWKEVKALAPKLERAVRLESKRLTHVRELVESKRTSTKRRLSRIPTTSG